MSTHRMRNNIFINGFLYFCSAPSPFKPEFLPLRAVCRVAPGIFSASYLQNGKRFWHGDVGDSTATQ